MEQSLNLTSDKFIARRGILVENLIKLLSFILDFISEKVKK